MKVFAVYDRAAVCFSQPHFLPTEGLAVRAFAQEVNRKDPQNVLNTNPGDFELHLLGEYDPVLGYIKSLDRPKLVIPAAQLVEQN